MVHFKRIIVNTLNKGDNKDNNNNNNNVLTLSSLIKRILFSKNMNYSY